MKYLQLIINIMISIPKIIDALKEYFKDRELKKIKEQKEKQEAAIEAMKAAKTKEEVKDANKKITSNLS